MLEALVKKHKFWINIVKSHGEEAYAEDIVQEMYLKVIDKNLGEKIYQNGKLNISYVYLILRSMTIDLHRLKARRQKVSIEEIAEIEHEEDLTNDGYAKFLVLLDEEMRTWYWFDRMLFKVYLDEKLSIRDLAEETKISASSVFNTIKNCKDRLRVALGEDWEDYSNNDYELL